MSRSLRGRYCAVCGRKTVAENQPGDWFLRAAFHFFLTVFTLGLWTPVFLWKLLTQAYRCTRCGHKV